MFNKGIYMNTLLKSQPLKNTGIELLTTEDTQKVSGGIIPLLVVGGVTITKGGALTIGGLGLGFASGFGTAVFFFSRTS